MLISTNLNLYPCVLLQMIVCSYMLLIITVASRYNYSVDYWSLGLVSHEVITGVRPFLPNMAPVSWSVLQNSYGPLF